MDTTRFDAVARRCGRRRFSRRPAGARGARPAPAMADADLGPAMLFVQSFQSGAIAPKDGEEGRFTITLEHGLGQTIFFSDRPDRIVGAGPTPRVLAGLGFPPDNPPNAALVVEAPTGETNIAVVELFNPVYDAAGPTVTYDAAPLADWEASSELGFTAAPTDLTALAPSFGSAHLFIDGCPDHDIVCHDLINDRDLGVIPSSHHDGFCYSPQENLCLPCSPWLPYLYDAILYWGGVCQMLYPDCGNACRAWGLDAAVAPHAHNVA